jgi:hypothetical protein
MVMGLDPRFWVILGRAPHCVFCTFGCGFLFGFRSFIFSSFVPLLGVFPLLFIYLCNQPYDETKWEYF